jgi:hypothetical protein
MQDKIHRTLSSSSHPAMLRVFSIRLFLAQLFMKLASHLLGSSPRPYDCLSHVPFFNQ